MPQAGGGAETEITTMANTDLSDRIAHTVEELRDRTADAVSSDGHSVWRALAQLRHRVEEVAPSVIERLDARDEAFARHLDDLDRHARRTTWPRRLLWLATGVAVGAGAAWLADPERGAARRAELAEQAAERARQGAEELRDRTRAASDRLRGRDGEQGTEVIDGVAAAGGRESEPPLQL